MDAYLADGWIVADSWSKLVRMVKRRVEAEEPIPNLDPGVWEELVNMEEETETDIEGGEPDTIITEGNGFGEEPCRQR